MNDSTREGPIYCGEEGENAFRVMSARESNGRAFHTFVHHANLNKVEHIFLSFYHYSVRAAHANGAYPQRWRFLNWFTWRANMLTPSRSIGRILKMVLGHQLITAV